MAVNPAMRLSANAIAAIGRLGVAAKVTTDRTKAARITPPATRDKAGITAQPKPTIDSPNPTHPMNGRLATGRRSGDISGGWDAISGMDNGCTSLHTEKKTEGRELKTE
jgi:hypothetical protein